jgi:hypothetical protein
MASRFVNNCRGKTGILSITFAKRELFLCQVRLKLKWSCQHFVTEWVESCTIIQFIRQGFFCGQDYSI